MHNSSALPSKDVSTQNIADVLFGLPFNIVNIALGFPVTDLNKNRERDSRGGNGANYRIEEPIA
jgi:hypothetical protein